MAGDRGMGAGPVDMAISNGISEPFHSHDGAGDRPNAQSSHIHGTAQNRRETALGG